MNIRVVVESVPRRHEIQLVFDFLHGNLKQVEMQTGLDADQGYREYLKVVEGGSLTIVDLGYFCLDAFWAIADKSAYFLSRYFYPTALFDKLGKRLDLEGCSENRQAIARKSRSSWVVFPNTSSPAL